MQQQQKEWQKTFDCTGSCKGAFDLQTGDRNRHEDACQNSYKTCRTTNIFMILVSVAISFTG